MNINKYTLLLDFFCLDLNEQLSPRTKIDIKEGPETLPTNRVLFEASSDFSNSGDDYLNEPRKERNSLLFHTNIKFIFIKWNFLVAKEEGVSVLATTIMQSSVNEEMEVDDEPVNFADKAFIDLSSGEEEDTSKQSSVFKIEDKYEFITSGILTSRKCKVLYIFLLNKVFH